MPGYAEYFEKNRPKPKFHMGDRVIGRWNKIPFVGSVAVDGMVSEEEGPRVSVFLDLPLKYKDKYKNIITVKHRDIRLLPKWK